MVLLYFSHEGFPKPPEKESKRLTLRQLLYLATIIGIGGGVYGTLPKSATEETVPELTKEELLKFKDKYCDMLTVKGRKEKGLEAPPWWAGHRRQILRSLHKLGSCLDPHSTEFDRDEVCRELANGIEKNEKGFHPILSRFYNELYVEFKCAEEESPKDVSEEMKKLTGMIEEKLLANYPHTRSESFDR